MKKIFSIILAMFAVCSMAFGQNYSTFNYVGSSKFTDNWSLTLQGGVLTTLDKFYTGNTAMAPIIVIGADKYVNKWLGFGVEGRTMIGTGDVNISKYNSKTAFEAFNLNGYVKFNAFNMFNFNGERNMFEPVLYTGLGWNHICTSDVPSCVVTSTQMARNAMLYRAGMELNFNLGKAKAFALVLNPSFVWNNVDNFKLTKNNCDFEVTAGIVYHFKTSNGTHSFANAKLYDQSEIDRLNEYINELESRPVANSEPMLATEKVVEKEVFVQSTYIVQFAKNSAELSDEAKSELDKVHGVVDIIASASPEGTKEYNQKLSERRAEVVADYLKQKGVTINSAKGIGAMYTTSNRIAIVTIR